MDKYLTETRMFSIEYSGDVHKSGIGLNEMSAGRALSAYGFAEPRWSGSNIESIYLTLYGKVDLLRLKPNGKYSDLFKYTKHMIETDHMVMIKINRIGSVRVEKGFFSDDKYTELEIAVSCYKITEKAKKGVDFKYRTVEKTTNIRAKFLDSRIFERYTVIDVVYNPEDNTHSLYYRGFPLTVLQHAHDEDASWYYNNKIGKEFEWYKREVDAGNKIEIAINKAECWNEDLNLSVTIFVDRGCESWDDKEDGGLLLEPLEEEFEGSFKPNTYHNVVYKVGDLIEVKGYESKVDVILVNKGKEDKISRFDVSESLSYGKKEYCRGFKIIAKVIAVTNNKVKLKILFDRTKREHRENTYDDTYDYSYESTERSIDGSGFTGNPFI